MKTLLTASVTIYEVDDAPLFSIKVSDGAAILATSAEEACDLLSDIANEVSGDLAEAEALATDADDFQARMASSLEDFMLAPDGSSQERQAIMRTLQALVAGTNGVVVK